MLSLFCHHVSNHSCTYCYVLQVSVIAKILLLCSIFFFCFVDRASRYICVIKTNLMLTLSSVYFFNQPLRVSGIFVAHRREIYCIHTTIGTCCTFQLTVCWSGWDGVPSQPCQQTVNWKAQHVQIVVCLQYTSWWWVTNMPETCRGWPTK